MPRCEATIQVPSSSQEVFDFVSEPTNLIEPLITGVKEVEYEIPDRLTQGSRMNFCIHSFGLRLELVLEVVELIERQRICTSQIKGPFRRWFHQYSLEELRSNLTLLQEQVDFEGPGGFLGLVATKARILENVNAYFQSSHQRLLEHFQQSEG